MLILHTPTPTQLLFQPRQDVVTISYSVITFFPNLPSTIAITITPESATATASSSSIPSQTFYYRGPRAYALLEPNQQQIVVVYVACIFAVVLAAGWRLLGVRQVLWPFKMFATNLHEMWHAILGVLTSSRVLSYSIDPELGGLTRLEPPRLTMFVGLHMSIPRLFAYPLTCAVGATFILCAFNVLASKACSFVIGILLLLPMWAVRDPFVFLSILCAEGLMTGLWFANHADILRYFVLFCGVLLCLYPIWDVLDDFVYRKPNESDCSLLSALHARSRREYWAILYILLACAMFTAAIIGGIALWKENTEGLIEQGRTFLPT